MNETSTEARSVIVERELPYPPEKIWRALTHTGGSGSLRPWSSYWRGRIEALGQSVSIPVRCSPASSTRCELGRPNLAGPIMERATRPTPNRSAGQGEVVAATIVTRMGGDASSGGSGRRPLPATREEPSKRHFSFLLQEQTLLGKRRPLCAQELTPDHGRLPRASRRGASFAANCTRKGRTPLPSAFICSAQGDCFKT